MKACRIVLADDQVLFRRELKLLIDSSSLYKIVGEVEDGMGLLNVYPAWQPNMVILDIATFGLRCNELIREIKERYPLMQVLVLTMNSVAESVYGAIFAGAEGYLLKSNAEKHLFQAMEKIRNGTIYLDRTIYQHLSKDFRRLFRGEGRYPVTQLTPREQEVIRLVIDGHTNREVAAILDISVRTAEKHRANIIQKLKTKKTAQMARYALQTGIISLYEE